MRSKTHTALTVPLVLHYTVQGLAIRNEIVCINGQWRNKLFLIVIHSFSLVKAAMNAPRFCKMLEKCLTGIDQCVVVLSEHLISLFSNKYV
jgi:hypothetical protein